MELAQTLKGRKEPKFQTNFPDKVGWTFQDNAAGLLPMGFFFLEWRQNTKGEVIIATATMNATDAMIHMLRMCCETSLSWEEFRAVWSSAKGKHQKQQCHKKTA